MEEYLKKLENIGLTKNEARVYIFLLEYQESKTGPICSKLKIPNSHIYHILDRLLDKGIISYKIVNNIKIFRPVNPQSLFSLFREKERQIEKEKEDLKSFISNLQKIKIKEKKENDFKYFEGVNGVRSMFTEFVESFKKDSKVFIASAPIAYEKWNAFLLELFHPPRIKKNVSQKLIVPTRFKKFGEERKKFQPIEIKYSPIEMDTEFGVCGDYTYFLSSVDKPYALLIKDKNLAKSQIRIFNQIWQQDVTVTYGADALKKAHEKTYAQLKPGEEYIYLGIPGYQPKKHHEYWKKDHERRVKAKIKCRLLFNKDTNKKILDERNKYEGCDARYMPTDIKTPSYMAIFKNTVMMTLPKKEPLVVEIYNKDIANSFKAYFEAFWKLTKKEIKN